MLQNIYAGIPVSIHPLLPWDEIVSACDIETKEEITIATGKKIHWLQVGSKFYCSQEHFTQLLNSIQTKTT